ncbi:tetratricopeptide repeat protein, partial [Helicobacter pylori]|uniref:tetratricopeptide repeat protein n=1 Tax=Helicobacter pylori TaxID=210 RepID=UPI001D050BEF
MLGSVKKAVFRVLCLGALCLCGGLMAEQDSKELIFLGITIYTDKNFTRAKEYFEKACKLNDADGCIILREAYSKAIASKNARESIEKALEHTATAKACKSNDAEKCKDLAEFYLNANDLKKTLEYHSKACKLNNAEGCMLSATFYNDMIKGLKKDKKDLEYYSKACELNYGDGCAILGDIYHNGEGVAKDLKKAFGYYSKACELNEALTCTLVGEFYR